MNKRLTVLNWKWWLVLPVALPVVAVLLIPSVIISLLELLIAALEFINIGTKRSKVVEKIVNWVQVEK